MCCKPEHCTTAMYFEYLHFIDAYENTTHFISPNVAYTSGGAIH